MDEQGLDWRPITREDVPALARLCVDSERVDQAGNFTDEVELAAQFDHAGLDLGRDTLVAVMPDGELAAYAVVYHAPTARETQRLFLSGGVHPDWRGRGLGRRVLDWQVARAEAMHGEVRPELPALMEAGGVDRDDPQRRVLDRAGFVPVRWWYEMARDLAALPRQTITPFIGFTAQWEEAVRRAHNEAFADHWGIAEVDEHTWRQRFSPVQGFRPDLSLIAPDGDEVAAYLLSFVHEAEIAVLGVPTAHVGYLGTRPACRGRGLGSGLLSAAMDAYRDAGYTVARLVVDSENGSGALDLYRRTGFEVDRRWVTYGRQLAPIPE